MEKYGQEEPPEFDLSNIKDIPIALFCGTEDLLSSPGDYKVLARVLQDNNSCVFYKEYDMGHLAFLIPNIMNYQIELLEVARGLNPNYKQCDIRGYESP
jgi:hypothetical protein